MTSAIGRHQSLLSAHGLSYEAIKVILSSRMQIIYASPEAEAVVRELKGAISHPDATVPPAILAYIAQGVMKRIQIQRILADFAPVLDECSITSEQRTYRCSVIGIPSRTDIDLAQIILILREDRWTTIRLRPVQSSAITRLSHWAKTQTDLLKISILTKGNGSLTGPKKPGMQVRIMTGS